MNKKIIDMNVNWKFHFGNCENAWYKGYDDANWMRVSLPHDWSVGQEFSKEYSSGTGYLAGGIGWYRLSFRLPEEEKGRNIRIVFDGIYKNSQIWCNSYHLGKRPNGYLEISYDISSLVNYGEEENVICVKVMHTDIADSRWFTGSGITRKVYLVTEPLVHPSWHSIFFKTSLDQENNAYIRVEQEVENNTSDASKVQVRCLFKNEKAEIVFELNGCIEVKEQDSKHFVMEGTWKNPVLWSIDEPHLYKMETYYQLINKQNTKAEQAKMEYLTDSIHVGIRDIWFDPNQGFYLNGISTVLKGVCLHHDGGCLGAAVTKEVWQRRLETLKLCGCNTIRGSHNPHMPELYDLCDELGFVMIDEAFDEWENPKNKWSTGHNVYPPKHEGYYEEFPVWHEKDLADMIKRDRNHPSVIMWSIGNEIDYPNDPYCHPMFENMSGNNDNKKPSAEKMYDLNKPNMERMVKIAANLVKIAKASDDSRPVTLAAAFPELSSRLGLLEVLDVVGYNYKEHLYQEDHLRFANKPFFGSENGHSYDAWLAVKENPYISGQCLWTGIDYLGEASGWPVHGSNSGLLTSAGFEKPEFQKRRSFWLEERMIALATSITAKEALPWEDWREIWNYEAGQMVQVKCYTNLSQVILYLNRIEVGRCSVRGKDGTFNFQVKFEEGVLEVEGISQEGVLYTAKLETAGPTKGLSIVEWKEANGLNKVEEIPHRVGYLHQIQIQLTDQQGRKVRAQDKELVIDVEGSGEFTGMDNGNMADLTPYFSNCKSTWKGQLVVYIRRTGTGRITVRIIEQSEAGEIYEMEIN